MRLLRILLRVLPIGLALGSTLPAQRDPVRELRVRFAPSVEFCNDFISDGARERQCQLGMTDYTVGTSVGTSIAGADSVFRYLVMYWSQPELAAIERFARMSREIGKLYGKPRTCGTYERLWTTPTTWARLRSYENGVEPNVTWMTEVHGGLRTTNTPAECIDEMMARLDRPESWPMPAAGALLEPLDARIPAFESTVRGCYRLTQWEPDDYVRFSPPSAIHLDSAVEMHNRFYRHLSMTPKAGLFMVTWQVNLPDSVRLEWIEPAAGPIHGGVFAMLGVRGDTLRGIALRYRDVSSGERPTPISFIRSRCS